MVLSIQEWLLETLCMWEVRPLLRYTCAGVTKENLTLIGKYPEAMVGDRESISPPPTEAMPEQHQE